MRTAGVGRSRKKEGGPRNLVVMAAEDKTHALTYMLETWRSRACCLSRYGARDKAKLLFPPAEFLLEVRAGGRQVGLDNPRLGSGSRGGFLPLWGGGRRGRWFSRSHISSWSCDWKAVRGPARGLWPWTSVGRGDSMSSGSTLRCWRGRPRAPPIGEGTEAMIPRRLVCTFRAQSWRVIDQRTQSCRFLSLGRLRAKDMVGLSRVSS